MLDYKVNVYLRHTEMENMYIREIIDIVAQDTKAYTFKFTLYDNEAAYDLTGRNVYLITKSTSGTIVQDKCTVTDAKNGLAQITLPNDMFCEEGIYCAEVQIWEGTNRLTSLPFDYTVRLSLQTNKSVIADTRYSLLQEALENVAEADGKSTEALETANKAKALADSQIDTINTASQNAQEALDRATSVVTQEELAEKVKINGVSTNVNFIEENGVISKIKNGEDEVPFPKTRDFNWAKSPQSKGYNRAIPVRIKLGAISTSQVINTGNKLRAHTQLFTTETKEFSVFNNMNDTYLVGVYAWKSDNTYIAGDNGSINYQSVSEIKVSIQDGYYYALFIKKVDESEITDLDLERLNDSIMVCDGEFKIRKRFLSVDGDKFPVGYGIKVDKAILGGQSLDCEPVLRYNSSTKEFEMNTGLETYRFINDFEFTSLNINECSVVNDIGENNIIQIYFNLGLKTFYAIGNTLVINHKEDLEDCLYIGYVMPPLPEYSKVNMQISVDNYLCKETVKLQDYTKRFVFEGDSITFGVDNSLVTPNTNAAISYPEWCCMALGIVYDKSMNRGVSGCTISYDSSFETSSPWAKSIYTRCKDYNYANADCVVIAAGTNDWSYGRVFGDVGSSDVTTVAGALNYIINKIYTDNPKARIFLVAPAQRFLRSGSYMDPLTQTNKNGVLLGDFCNDMVNYAKAYGIPILNQFENSVINKWNYKNGTVSTDWLHFKTEGYRQMGYKVANFIENNI